MSRSEVRIYGIIVFGLMVISGCQKDAEIKGISDIISVPSHFPAMNFPEGNEFSYDRWLLGKKLFYDQRLSLNNSVSCASCHHADYAFSDTIALSIGDNHSVGKSNAPTLTNIGYNPAFTRAGGVPTLEMQILVPIQEHDEFNTNLVELVQKLSRDSIYAQFARKAYNREFDAFVLTRAISNFERSFISGNSAYDHYHYQNKQNLLSQAQINGMNLFFSTKTNCSQCHSGFNFTNYSYESNALLDHYRDSGRMRLTRLESDRGRFKVPTLRNIALTAPYMHDGSLSSLDQVIELYNSGGKSHTNKSNLIKPLNLTQTEKRELIEFLNSLTDYSFINNQNLK